VATLPGPAAREGRKPERVQDEDALSAALSRAETHELSAACERQRASLEELLLAALVRALAAESGGTRVSVEVEGHGRDAEGAWAARTVGWFTTLSPVPFCLDGARTAGAALRVVKEALRGLPGGRSGWSLARYGGDERRAQLLAGVPRPEVSFNYLGRIDGALGGRGGRGRFLLLDLPRGQRAPEAPRTQALELDAWIAGGELQARWLHGRRAAALVERLSRRWLASVRELCALAVGDEALSASDFPLAGLDAAALARVVSSIRARDA
jgi:non-ribosomal peptide synthase protein (TIGR01720 family)